MLSALRAALTDGSTQPLADLYAEDALLDASLPGARTLVRGREAIAAQLSDWWRAPATLVEWEPKEHPGGVALWTERLDAEQRAERRRHYVHVRGGIIQRHWIYAAPPRSVTPATPVEDQTGFERLGELVDRTPLVSTGWSGNRIERLRLADGRTLIAKRIAPSTDWIGRATQDRGREALLHTTGTFARVPSSLEIPIVDAWPASEDAWWVAMRDVSHALLDASSPIPREGNRLVLAAAAAMWEEFWGDELRHLSTLEDRLVTAGLATADRERAGLDLLPKQLEAAWEAFAEAVEPDVTEAVLRLLDDPAPLAAASADFGQTLLHGDLRDENIGFEDGKLVVLDWGLASLGHPVVDLAWWMVHDVWRIEASHDEVVEDFRRALGERDDPRAVDLLPLIGLVEYGWIFGHSAVIHTNPAERAWAREELAWWVPRARRALETWPP